MCRISKNQKAPGDKFEHKVCKLVALHTNNDVMARVLMKVSCK